MDGIRRSIGKFIPVLVIILASPETFGWTSNSITATQPVDRGVSSLKKGLKTSTTTQLWSSAPNNPFSSLLGDFASSLMGKADSVKPNAKLDASLDAIMASAGSTKGSSWTDIREILESMQTPEERQFRDNLAKGYGVGSPMHKVRLYDESNKESDIRVTFYRDHASWW